MRENQRGWFYDNYLDIFHVPIEAFYMDIRLHADIICHLGFPFLGRKKMCETEKLLFCNAFSSDFAGLQYNFRKATHISM